LAERCIYRKTESLQLIIAVFPLPTANFAFANFKMVLVTGASGFLGGELVTQLVKGGEAVRIIRRTHSNLSYLDALKDKLEIVEGDVLDIPSLEAAMEGVDKIYHGAAVISYDTSQHAHMYKVNVEGTANVVNAALKQGVKRILHISSIAAIGAKPNKALIDEATKWENHPYNTYYGVTKMLAEREVFRGIEEGLEAVIINPGIIVGVGHDEHKATMRTFKQISKGKLPFYMRGTNAFVDVEDVAAASIRLMNSDISGERFIAISENWPFRRYFDTVADELKAPHPKYEITPLLGNILVKIDWLRAALFSKKRSLTKENLVVVLENFEFSNDKIKDAIGFEFKPLKQTLHEIAITLNGTVK
jgi:nucleoside-diphosphate-sugar epimerase